MMHHNHFHLSNNRMFGSLPVPICLTTIRSTTNSIHQLASPAVHLDLLNRTAVQTATTLAGLHPPGAASCLTSHVPHHHYHKRMILSFHCITYWQSSDTAEYLPSMWLGSRNSSEPTIEIATTISTCNGESMTTRLVNNVCTYVEPSNKGDSFLQVHFWAIQSPEDRQYGKSAIGEAGVDFAPLVTHKGPVRQLQASDITHNKVCVDHR